MSMGTGCHGDDGVGHGGVPFEQEPGAERKVGLWISGGMNIW